MSIVQTTLVFAGIPIGFILIVTLLVYARTEVSTGTRYRPGRPWEHTPVWYLPHPIGGAGAHAPAGHAELEAGESAHEPNESVGGASGEW